MQSGLFAQIYRDIAHNKVGLPSMPSIAIRLRKVMSNDRFSMDDLAKVVQTDPGASAYLIQMANGPLYRTRVPTQDISSAVRKFGIPITRNLVMAYAMRRLFLVESGTIGNAIKGVWRQSSKVAAISSAMARKFGGFNADKALLAGLMQDVGALPLLMKLGSNPAHQVSGEEITEALDTYTGPVGVVLLKNWGMDEEFIEVARSRKQWDRDPAPQPDLADVVLISRLLSYVGSRKKRQWPNKDEVPAFMKFNAEGFTAEYSLDLLREAQKEILEVRSILGG